MIPGRYDYHRPASVAEAVSLLASLGEDARVLAGGHSLIPMMKLRLAQPTALVDIARIPDLRTIRRDGDALVVGAAVTQQELIASDLLAAACPILSEAAQTIADPQVRACGTVGGNVANGDPGNDLPALMQCLDATYTAVGPAGTRSLPARTFYEGAYATALRPGEIVTEVRIPTPPVGHGWAYEKLKRKVGDYATAAAAVVLTRSGGAIATAAVALTNLGDTPLFAEAAGDALVGTAGDAAAAARAAEIAGSVMAPASDGRGPAEYRTAAGAVIVRRAIAKALSRAA
ncbi:FAD binding domain-containing protein [Azospirillum sp. ST 5-10]|uniref:FAD binding domain-containing protein n=1 Tax=unclassified Azospirillum TaxID=2630922 RepID=UPI003F49C527